MHQIQVTLRVLLSRFLHMCDHPGQHLLLVVSRLSRTVATSVLLSTVVLVVLLLVVPRLSSTLVAATSVLVMLFASFAEVKRI